MNYNKPTDKYNIAANCAIFLISQGQSIFGTWGGRMPAKQQREIFGTFLGKGWIKIDGSKDTVSHTVKVCFGLDWDTQTMTVQELAMNPGTCPHGSRVTRELTLAA